MDKILPDSLSSTNPTEVADLVKELENPITREALIKKLKIISNTRQNDVLYTDLLANKIQEVSSTLLDFAQDLFSFPLTAIKAPLVITKEYLFGFFVIAAFTITTYLLGHFKKKIWQHLSQFVLAIIAFFLVVRLNIHIYIALPFVIGANIFRNIRHNSANLDVKSGFGFLSNLLLILSLAPLMSPIFKIPNSDLSIIWWQWVWLVAIIYISYFCKKNNYRIRHWIYREENYLENTSPLVLGIFSFLSHFWYWLTLGLMFLVYLTWAINPRQVFDLISGILASLLLLVCIIYSNIKLVQLHRTLKPTSHWARTIHSAIPSMPLILYLLSVLIFLDIWAIDLFNLLSEYKIWLMHILSISILIFIGRIFWIAINLIIEYQINKTQNYNTGLFFRTAGPVLKTVGHILVIIVICLLILNNFIQITPILYSFSGLILAFGLANQAILKDFVNGFTILVEGNLVVGDFVQIGTFSGTVELITLRSVFLRHTNGSLQNIPFSKIEDIINKTRGWTGVIMEVFIAHENNLTIVQKALNQAFEEFKQGAKGNEVLEPLKYYGINTMNERGMTLSVFFKTKPDPRGLIMRDFYHYLKIAFDKANINQASARVALVTNEN